MINKRIQDGVYPKTEDNTLQGVINYHIYVAI